VSSNTEKVVCPRCSGRREKFCRLCYGEPIPEELGIAYRLVHTNNPAKLVTIPTKLRKQFGLSVKTDEQRLADANDMYEEEGEG